MPNIGGLVWLGYLSHVSEDISASRTRINLSIASLKRCCKAGSFEYNFSALLGGNAHTQNPFFEDFDPISWFYIYSHIDFPRNIILSVKIEFSLRLSGVPPPKTKQNGQKMA